MDSHVWSFSIHYILAAIIIAALEGKKASRGDSECGQLLSEPISVGRVQATIDLNVEEYEDWRLVRCPLFAVFL